MSKKLNRAITEETEAEEKERAEENEFAQYVEDLKIILSTNEGKRFFKKFFSDSMIFETTFTGNSETFFREGKRNVGLRIFDHVMRARPDLLLELVTRKKGDRYNGD